jgi:hypothetical protein
VGDRRWSSLPLPVPFPCRPNPTTVTSSLRPRNEVTPAAAFKSARVQPFKCSKQVMPATRKPPLQPLLFRKGRKPFLRGLPCRGTSIPRRDPPDRSPLSLRRAPQWTDSFPRRTKPRPNAASAQRASCYGRRSGRNNSAGYSSYSSLVFPTRGLLLLLMLLLLLLLLCPYRFPAGQTLQRLRLSLSLSLSLRAIPRGPPPLVGPVRRGSDPANSYVSLSLSLSLSLPPCDSPWPTAAGRASSPWLRPRRQGSSGGPSVSGPLPQRSPVADRRPRFRFASAILILDSRSRNLKPKPQALNSKKKSPPPAVRARPSSKAKPRRRARRLRLRLRFVNEASPCARNPSQPSQPSLVGPLPPRNLSTAGQTLNRRSLRGISRLTLSSPHWLCGMHSAYHRPHRNHCRLTKVPHWPRKSLSPKRTVIF